MRRTRDEGGRSGRRYLKVPWVLMVMVGVFAAACGEDGGAGTDESPSPAATTSSPAGATSVAGTYECLQPQSTEPDIIEMDADGDLFITQGGETFGPGTWTVEGDAGSFNPDTPDKETFTVEDGAVVFADGTNCRKVSDATLIGTYECHPGGPSDPVVSTIDVRAEGTVTITVEDPQGSHTNEGTWELQGTSMTFTINGQPDTFEIADRTLDDCEKLS